MARREKRNLQWHTPRRHPPVSDLVSQQFVSPQDFAGAHAAAAQGMRHTEDIEPAVAEGPKVAILPHSDGPRGFQGPPHLP